MALITAVANLGVMRDGRAEVDPDKDLGRAYNQIFERLCPGDWCCLLDHDAMFTTRGWYLQLMQAIRDNPQPGLITAVTNRIGRRFQIAPDCPQSHDMREHFAFGKKLADEHGAKAQDITQQSPISGVVMAMSHATWEALGGFVQGERGGFFGVDNWTHRAVQKLGKRVYLLPGLYVYHWYRGDGQGHGPMPKANTHP